MSRELYTKIRKAVVELDEEGLARLTEEVIFLT